MEKFQAPNDASTILQSLSLINGIPASLDKDTEPHKMKAPLPRIFNASDMVLLYYSSLDAALADLRAVWSGQILLSVREVRDLTYAYNTNKAWQITSLYR